MGVRKSLRGARVFGAIVAVFVLGTGCIENSSLVETSNEALSQNCALPNAVAVKSIGRRLASQSIDVDREFCAKSENYTCYARVFSPNAVDGTSVESECGKVSALGGNVCLKVSRQSYNTRDAATAPDTAPEAVRPGGEYNRSEYVCHQHVLKDGDTFLAVGQGDSLAEALGRSAGECAGVSPRIAAAREGAK